MMPYYFVSTKRQISEIKFKNLKSHQQNFEIDSLQGDKLINVCKNCNEKSYQYLNILEHPIMGYNDIKPCKIRSYEAFPFTDENGEITSYGIDKFTLLTKDDNQYISYLQANNNKLKTFKEHHVWVYVGTEKNTQKYRCYWCNNTVEVKYKSLPRKYNDNVGEFNGDLDICMSHNDYNHYMYDLLDNNKTIYQQCLKCNKKSYAYLQQKI